MNVKNNKRRRESIEKIEKTFIGLLQKKEISEITVSDICKLADLNRSTFYANYIDIYDLADKIRDTLEQDFHNHFSDNSEKNDALKMFRHIKDNMLFYKTYFKLGYHSGNQTIIYDMYAAERYFANRHLDYHIEFFRNGLNAIIKMWLDRDCAESPEEMAEILATEYQGRK